ncbi:MAG: hypothetical protein DMD99_07330 [Candidatus Rokuibacteriota bacterium]|nr:MAG: hypothetical protein DMD99_07330 [Candidatus Rokubacteria bacterium]
MTESPRIEGLLRRIRREIRRRRAEYYGLRGAFWGAVVGVAVLLAKHGVGGAAPWAAAALVILGAAAGIAYGAARRVGRADTARVADRAFGLDDRVATTLEWAERADRTRLVDSLVADTVARVEALEVTRVVRRVVPSEARFLAIPVLACVVLAISPPIPMPSGRFPDFLPSGEEEREERASSSMLEETSRPLAKDPLKRPSFEERDFAQRAGGSGATTTGDLSAIFKDTSLASQRPDFNSFMKKGDERLRMLEQVDRLPDLQSDFTNSQYKMVYRKSKALTGGLRPDQISPQKLRELLEEMERLGRKGGANWSGDAMEGMEALEGGQSDRALDAMQKALDKMRAMDEAQRSGKGLRGGRENERGGRGRDRARGDGMGPEDQDFGEGEGLMPGRGRSGSPKGEATQRLRASPYDVGVEGESRRGRKDGYDTNLTGRGGSMASRLQYLGVIGQYRKAMEDAITREQVPRDFHDQIRSYFQALDER